MNFDADLSPSHITTTEIATANAESKKRSRASCKPVNAWFKRVGANIRGGENKHLHGEAKSTSSFLLGSIASVASAQEESRAKAISSDRWLLLDRSLSSDTFSPSLSSCPSAYSFDLLSSLPQPTEFIGSASTSSQIANNLYFDLPDNVTEDDDAIALPPWFDSPSSSSDSSFSTTSDTCFDSPVIMDATQSQPRVVKTVDEIEKISCAPAVPESPLSLGVSAAIFRNGMIKQNHNYPVPLVSRIGDNINLHLPIGKEWNKTRNLTNRRGPPPLPFPPPSTFNSLNGHLMDDIILPAKREWIPDPVSVGSQEELKPPCVTKSPSETMAMQAEISLKRTCESIDGLHGPPASIAPVERRDATLDRLPTIHQLRHPSLDCPCIKRAAKRQKKWATMCQFSPTELSNWDIVELVDFELEAEFDDLRHSPAPSTSSMISGATMPLDSEDWLDLELERLLDEDFDMDFFETSISFELPTFSEVNPRLASVQPLPIVAPISLSSPSSLACPPGSGHPEPDPTTAEPDIYSMNERQYVQYLFSLPVRSSANSSELPGFPLSSLSVCTLRSLPASASKDNFGSSPSTIFREASDSDNIIGVRPSSIVPAADIFQNDFRAFKANSSRLPNDTNFSGKIFISTAITLAISTDRQAHSAGFPKGARPWNGNVDSRVVSENSSDDVDPPGGPNLLVSSTLVPQIGNSISINNLPVDCPHLEGHEPSSARSRNFLSLRTPALAKHDPSRRTAVYWSFSPAPSDIEPLYPLPSLPSHIVFPRLMVSTC